MGKFDLSCCRHGGPTAAFITPQLEKKRIRFAGSVHHLSIFGTRENRQSSYMEHLPFPRRILLLSLNRHLQGESMPIALLSFIRLSRIGRIVLVPIFAALFVFALCAAGQQTPSAQAGGASAAPASQAPANEASQASCPSSFDRDIPVNLTFRTKVTGQLDSGHMKVGNKIWVTLVKGLVFPGCTLNQGSAIYGRVTSAVSQKNPNSSELSLVFDHADCEGHPKKEMPLRVIGLLGLDASMRMHDAVPLVMSGGSRSVSAAASKTAYTGDDELNPGGPVSTVHPGIVIGIPKVKLEPQGGPECGARFTSTNHSVQLETGAVLIMIAPSTL